MAIQTANNTVINATQDPALTGVATTDTQIITSDGNITIIQTDKTVYVNTVQNVTEFQQIVSTVNQPGGNIEGAVQYKSGANFGGDAGLVYNDFSDTLLVGTLATDSILHANGAPWEFGNSYPGGINSSIQFNSNGGFGGGNALTWNVFDGVLSATNFSGDGSRLTNLPGANIVGAVPFAETANIANYVTNPNQTAITRVGTLVGLTVAGDVGVTGTVIAGTFSGNASGLHSIPGANVTGNVANALYAEVAGTVANSSQPNITSVGTLVNVITSGNLTSTQPTFHITAGNITVQAENGNTSGGAVQVLGGNAASGQPGNVTVQAGAALNSGQGALTTVIGGTGYNAASGGNVVISGGHALAIGTGGNVVIEGGLSVGGTNGNVVIGKTGTSQVSIGATGVTVNLGGVDDLKITGGANGQILRTDGAGNLVWASDAAATPGGLDTQLQFNANGSFGGIPSVTYDGIKLSLGTTDEISIGGGTNGYVLQTDGTGNLSWTAQTGSGGNAVAAGANTQIQFNDSGFLNGNAGLTFNKLTGTLATTNLSAIAVNADLLQSNISIETPLIYVGNAVANGQVTFASSNLELTQTKFLGKTFLGEVGNIQILDGVPGQVLSTDGAGNLSWSTVTTTPAGSNGEIQFNQGGNFSASPNLTFIGDVLTVSGQTVTSSLLAGSANAAGEAYADFSVASVTLGVVTGPSITVTPAGGISLTSASARPIDIGGNNATSVNILSELTINNSTLVANLNADQLDGFHANVAATTDTVVVRDSTGSISANEFLGTISGANVAGEVSFAAVANSVALANVTGFDGNVANVLAGDKTFVELPTRTSLNIGTVANVDLNGNVGEVLSGTGTWISVGGVGTVTEVGGNGSGLGFTLTGTVTSSGNLDLTVPSATDLRTNLSIGNVANLDLNGNASTVLSGDGTFVSFVGVSTATPDTLVQRDANASFAANVVTSAGTVLVNAGNTSSATAATEFYTSTAAGTYDVLTIGDSANITSVEFHVVATIGAVRTATHLSSVSFSGVTDFTEYGSITLGNGGNAVVSFAVVETAGSIALTATTAGGPVAEYKVSYTVYK